jgi:hypothetical protein
MTIKPGLQKILKGILQKRKINATIRYTEESKHHENNGMTGTKTYLSIIPVIAKGLNSPTKRHRLVDWI